MTIAIGVSDVGLDGESNLNSDKHLRCLSRNSALKFEVICSSSFSSQIIRGTSWFILASTSSLENEEDREDEEGKEDDEDRVVVGGVLAF
ncbi:hypothetical protein PVL29_002360 [Vitis rotundifolia]|uniref:Uncharacterized protein n=1 Tax=Vitis rotundifolia TaxID=103349 RepID=A0AA39AGQ8_VITRO|nr:hypothetical protein PVL29_002360 [Vitis rotundifolia]